MLADHERDTRRRLEALQIARPGQAQVCSKPYVISFVDVMAKRGRSIPRASAPPPTLSLTPWTPTPSCALRYAPPGPRPPHHLPCTCSLLLLALLYSRASSPSTTSFYSFLAVAALCRAQSLDVWSVFCVYGAWLVVVPAWVMLVLVFVWVCAGVGVCMGVCWCLYGCMLVCECV